MLRRVYTACIAVAALTGVCSGQIAVTSVGGPPFVEAWVDPCNGNDGLAQLSSPPCQSAPFQTINAAIVALQPFAGPGSPGLVHCDAGIYAASTNGESFPINMRNWIHLQGVGARQCVIRGEGASAVGVFFPTSGGSCKCGSYGVAEVLVDITQLYDQNEEMIDGFTFQGGDIQVYSRSEATCYARLSNCVFDMLAGDKTVLIQHDHSLPPVSNPLPGPSFGILIVHDYHPGVPYYNTPINILNNTFVMAWLPGDDDQAVFSRPDAVAICDVNNPLCDLPPWQSDPNTTLRGIGPLNIQNNLIRTAPGQVATALLGIDNTAVTARLGTPTGPTNAFDPRLVGGPNATGLYCSMFNTYNGNGMAPIPRVNIDPTAAGGRDAAFVGEMLTRAFAQPVTVARDWRILPSSALVDVGSMPRPLAAGGVLAAQNGTRYTEPALVPLSSFDLDGEVYGNPRVQPAFGSAVALADIGFDETHLMVDCAGYANDSVSHRWNPAVTPQVCGPLNPGQPFRGLVFPGAGAFALFETRLPIPFPLITPCAGPAFYPAYTTMWGTVVPPATIAGFPPFYNLVWMNLGILIAGPSGAAAPVAYAAPNDPTILNFGAGFAPTVGATPWQFVNEQSLFTPTGSATTFISNLQSSTD